MRAYLLAAAVVCLTLPLTPSLKASGSADAVVIIYATFPGNNVYEIGTGAFVDHDGLVLTADHVVHHVALSPPVTTLNATASETQPTHLTIYSAFLKAKIDVDVSTAGSVIGGQLTPAQWIDISLIRVPLTDAQKLQIQPLDLSMAVPSMSDSVVAIGPLCTTQNANCYQPSSVTTSLASDPTLTRDYQIRQLITPGYSGGPLLNSSGNIVGVASWGDVIVNGQAVTRASYVPAAFVLRYFLDLARIPKPSPLTSTDACIRAHSLSFLTAFDWEQLSSRWAAQANLLQVADQCQCCCESLDKVKNAFAAPSSTGSCSPPFCAQQRLYGLSNAILLAVRTNTIDASTADLYKQTKAVVHQVDVVHLSKEEKLSFYDRVATLFTTIAKTKNMMEDSTYDDATKVAFTAVLKSSRIQESAGTYQAFSDLFGIDGDHTHAAAATILGQVIQLPEATVRSQLKINQDQLRKSVQQGALAHIGTVNAIQ
jgi:hypothetical protein